MRMPLTLAAAGAVLLAAVGWWMHDTGYLLSDSVVAVTPAQVTTGRGLYAANCAICHGTDLEGAPDWRPTLAGVAPPPHTADGPAARRHDTYLIRMVRDGSAVMHDDRNRDGMPAFANLLSNREIHAVVAFLKERWPHREMIEADAGRDGSRAGLR